jgi:hypothetical protein
LFWQTNFARNKTGAFVQKNTVGRFGCVYIHPAPALPAICRFEKGSETVAANDETRLGIRELDLLSSVFTGKVILAHVFPPSLCLQQNRWLRQTLRSR